jgi:beta-phosphoglucomutase-like phosphatase (HAD superfamily)
LAPDEALVFEDSEVGMQAALNAGLRVLKVAWRED